MMAVVSAVTLSAALDCWFLGCPGELVEEGGEPLYASLLGVGQVYWHAGFFGYVLPLLPEHSPRPEKFEFCGGIS
jgi:hypothetical protein